MVLKRPINWNPCKVVIAALDETRSKVDPVFRSARAQKRRPVQRTYAAQVNFGRKDQDKKTRRETGDRSMTFGWLVVRTCDLAPNVPTLPKPKKGDQLVVLYKDTDQEQAVDYLIEHVRHESPLRGRPLLLYIEFAHNREKAPSFNG